MDIQYESDKETGEFRPAHLTPESNYASASGQRPEIRQRVTTNDFSEESEAIDLPTVAEKSKEAFRRNFNREMALKIVLAFIIVAVTVVSVLIRTNTISLSFLGQCYTYYKTNGTLRGLWRRVMGRSPGPNGFFDHKGTEISLTPLSFPLALDGGLSDTATCPNVPLYSGEGARQLFECGMD